MTQDQAKSRRNYARRGTDAVLPPTRSAKRKLRVKSQADADTVKLVRRQAICAYTRCSKQYIRYRPNQRFCSATCRAQDWQEAHPRYDSNGKPRKVVHRVQSSS